MGGLPDPDWYLDHVLVHAGPGGGVQLGPVGEWRLWWREAVDGLPQTPAVAIAIVQGLVVTRAQLHGLGWVDHDIRRELRRRRWSRPARGVVSPIVVTADDHQSRRRRHALRSCGALLRRPDHVISGRSACVLHGLPTLAIPVLPALTTTAIDTSGKRRGALVYEASLDDHAVTTWFGAAVTTVARTHVDLSRHDRRDGIMATDAALREGLVTPGELAIELAGAAGWPGVAQAREIAALADPRAESPLESVTRLALHDDGFPPPEPQFPIGGYWVDFCWPEHRLVLEADGRGKYADDQLWREKKREAALRAFDYRVERVLWSDVLAEWPAFSRRLRKLMR